jgi:hypothetical protein
LIIAKKTLEDTQLIQNVIENDLPYSKSLDSAFASIEVWESPHFTYTVYESLKSKGIDIISNDSIKNEITFIFEVLFTTLVDDYDKKEWAIYESVVYPTVSKFLYNYGRSVNRRRVLSRPNNFEELKNSDEFLNMLGMIIRNRQFGLVVSKGIDERLSNLIEMIDKELNK